MTTYTRSAGITMMIVPAFGSMISVIYPFDAPSISILDAPK
jgi:hypothetical protein